ncbi:MAG TPA: BamA/TamA family outer membrane protein, partial [Thermoanaerobaculia bacterium]
RIVLPLTGTYEENDHVLGHEMVHVFQFDMANRLSSSRRRFAIQTMPLWMIEGLAEYLSQGRVDPQTAMWMRDAAMRDELPTPEKLMRDPRLSPYQYGQAFWAYIGGRWSDRAVIETFLAAGFLGIEGGIQRVLGIPSAELFSDWHDASRRLYEPVIANRWGPDRLGDPLVRQEGRDIDVSPSLSPDGRYVAFLSSRELFSIDLFLAEAATGKVLGRLVSSASDPHMDALRFIDSAGSWSPDGKRLAFIAVEKGDNRIGIVDVESREVVDRFAIPGVPAITQVAWSPDGRRLAVSGLRGGVTDIFLYDLQTKQVSQLTSDRYSDLQPSWSPDGRFIAVSSDRGPGTSFETLQYARPRISIIDVATGNVRTLEIFPDAKHINPYYSPDGSSIFFVADPDGVAQVFEYELSNGQTQQLTNVATGVTGITDLAPALTVSARTGDAIYTYFRDGRWTMYRVNVENATHLERPGQLAGGGAQRGALLPPPVTQDRAQSTVAEYLQSPQEGLPAPNVAFTRGDYDASLRLSYIGPPTLGVGYSEVYGGYGGGSFAALWTDVLGDHQVGLTIQGGSSSGDFGTLFGGETYYLNLKNRVQWGGSASHIPYITAAGSYYSQEDVDVGSGEIITADVYNRVLERVTLDEGLFLTRYPLGRTRRLEFNAGATHLGFSAEIEKTYFADGSFLGTDRDTVDTFPSVNYYRAQTAFVGDSSFFGFLSPVSGTRYRYQVEAYSGDLQFQTGLADWRRYFFARPVTFAVRAYHYGRYGEDAEDERMSPLFIGYATMVRGYESDSFRGDECSVTPTSGCSEFDRLIGSKIALGSFEVRVPLFGTEEFGIFENPYFPVELAAFFDVGAAWTEDEDVTWEWDTDTPARVPVASAGVAVRIGLGGYLPLQFFYAFPLHRPLEKGGVFGFTIAPGW